MFIEDFIYNLSMKLYNHSKENVKIHLLTRENKFLHKNTVKQGVIMLKIPLSTPLTLH